MKKYMKKIIVGIFAFALLFTAQSVFAATWNGASNDCRTVNVANATTGEGWDDPCWTGTSVSADAGDVVNVRVYYHNTGSQTANNTYLVLDAPSGSSTSHRFTGSITSDQGNLSFGPVYIKTTTSQSLSFGSVKWYTENTKETLTNLLSGQDGSEVVENGLYVGSIAPGWNTQGSIVVSFRVSNNTEVELCRDSSASNYLEPLPCVYPQVNYCTILNFSASDTNINKGDSTTLIWSTKNCENVNISNLGYNIPTSGSQIVYPPQTTTYQLNARDYGTSSSVQTRSLTVNVKDIIVSEMSGSIDSSPSSCAISSGNSTCSATLSWTTINPVSVSAITKQGDTIASGNNGSKTVPVSYGSTTYYLYNNSRLLDSTSVSAYCVSGSTWTGSYCKEDVIVSDDCTISNFSVSDSSINEGEYTTLNWNTNNCNSVTISNIGTVQTSGSRSVNPSETTSYLLTARNYYGATQTRSVTVYVDDNNNNNSSCSIDSFSASDTSIDEGDETELKWRTSGCDRVKITDLGYVDDDGEESVEPDEDTTYILTAYDDNGYTRTDTVRVYVDEDGSNSDDECTINSFTTTDSYINKGDSTKIKWNTTDCDDVYISGVGDVDDDGSETVYPYSTTTYTLRASDNNRTRTKTLRINVDYNNNKDPYIAVYNTDVVTTVATSVSQTGAQINGLVTSSNNNNANVYFEYGTSINLGSRTNTRTVNGNTNFSEYLSNLSPNTIYYFQAVSEGNNGISKGAIEVFKTGKIAVVNVGGGTTKIITQGKTVYGSASPVMLQIENKYQAIGSGDIIEYTVYYKNISSSTLSNPMVQVYIPKGINILNISRGTYSEDDRTLSVPIEDLKPNDDGEIYLQAKVGSIDTDLAQIPTTAVLVYTNPNGAQENAMAYVLNTPKDSNLLGASAFFGNMFGLGLIGWLLLIVLILLVILIARSYYSRKDTVVAK